MPPSSSRNLFVIQPAPLSVAELHKSLKWLEVCHDGDPVDDVAALFDRAFRVDQELPVLKGFCRYVGFNAREVEGVFLLTNRRLLLFSTEMGAKIVLVELTRRLLGKLPVPFLDSLLCFVLFSLPRAVYVALRGGKKRVVARALAVDEEQLLSAQPPLRKVQEFELARIPESIAQADIGTCVWTGLLARKFGISFSPTALSKSLSVPKDLILSECHSLDALVPLLEAIRPTLARLGIDLQLDDNGSKFSLVARESAQRAAA